MPTINGTSGNGTTTAGFSQAAGERRHDQVGGNTNGHGIADLVIRLDGLHTLSGRDFVL